MVNGQQPNPPVDLASNSVMLVVRMGRLGNRRKVATSMVEVDADPDAVHVGKELLESPELKAVTAEDNAIRQWVYARSLPSYGTLRDGVYRLPLALVDQVDEELEAFRLRRQALIDKFLERYPAMVNEAVARLRALYNPADYPHLDQVAARFTFSYRYLAFMTPQTLSARLLAREREKAAAEVSTEVEEIKVALRTGFAELIAHAADRLAVRPDGKNVTFRDSMVTNMEEFFAYFAARNLVGDDELATLVERARAAMKGVTAQTLRTDDITRASVKDTLDRVRVEMDSNLLVRPRRRLILDKQESISGAA